MRANQPMGLSPAAVDLLAGLVQIGSERIYEGYWEAQYPLADYVAPTPEMARLLTEQEQLNARLAEIGAAIQEQGQKMVAVKRHVYSEYEQSVLYSSGPVMFLALRSAQGVPVAASLWSDCAMEDASEGHCACGGADCAPGCPQNCAESDTEPRRAADTDTDDDDWSEGAP